MTKLRELIRALKGVAMVGLGLGMASAAMYFSWHYDLAMYSAKLKMAAGVFAAVTVMVLTLVPSLFDALFGTQADTKASEVAEED